ncbi:myelin-associated neurite-outgrowth inhibitor isoform X1 [Hippoglossus hippoglossus]|uniref:myelin-associated neurite-outgrowth inhibitor isoform X1 n=1 Tax=Hippoglossus hippoglossus TaxID=8267 RepID=UPI00148C1269|nr:myelin-associated neurite-outgrowth inhibitor isoform X1 [Hippoglossus hippoglossus]
MNPVYSPSPTGVPFANTKGLGYPAGFPVGYAAAPAYNPNIYAGANAAFPSGYAPGTPFKMSCSPNSGTVPPYSSSPNPYPAAVYPVRSTYPQQNPYAQVINTVTTAGHVLHTAAVRRTASCDPSHDGGPAERDACGHVCPDHASSPPKRRRHGDGSRHHHGHVRWDFVDNSITSICCPPPDAHISDSRHTQLQLRAAAVVKRGKRQEMVDMHSHSTPVFFALGEDLLCQSLQPVTPLPA